MPQIVDKPLKTRLNKQHKYLKPRLIRTTGSRRQRPSIDLQMHTDPMT